MKKIVFLILAFLLVPTMFAINLKVSQNSENFFIVGDSKPVEISFDIKNNEETSNFRIYNLVGFSMERTEFYLKKGEQKTIAFEVSPRNKMDMRGKYAIEFFIENTKGEIFSTMAIIQVLEPKNAIEIKINDIAPGNEKIEIIVKNLVDYEFEEIDLKFTSDFFTGQKQISLDPYEERDFSFKLNKEEINKLPNGFYTVKTKVESLGIIGESESRVRFIEKDSLSTDTTKSGFLIKKQTIEKTNTGNTQIRPEITIEKNIFSRYFTSVSPKADLIEREGFKVKYTWIKTLSPGERITIKVSTNWIYPIIILALILWIVYTIGRFAFTDVIVKKQAKYLRTKGGEFALKVSIQVKAQKYIERLNLIERLPGVVKVYPKFGGEAPARINEEKGRMDWRFEKMEAGEIRRISYILYSKVGIMGRLALPRAKAIYEKGGKIKKSSSNKCFFISSSDQ